MARYPFSYFHIVKKQKKQKNSSQIFSFIALFRQKRAFLAFFWHRIVPAALKIPMNPGNVWQ